MAWNDEKSGWLKIKEGDVKEFTIEDIVEKEGNAKINPIPGKNYYYSFTTNEGMLTINNLGFFNALVSNKVRKGDRIRVEYIKKGTIGNPSKYNIIIVKKGDEVQLEPDEVKNELFEGTKEPFDKQF